jgi:membrane associated rhomboid family serine protease
MLPIGDENAGQHRRPYVVQALLVVNIAIFLYQLTLSERELFDFIYRWGVVPAYVSEGDRLYTLITCAFLHGGWVHLIGNMLFLWIFGDNVEDVFGHLGFALFYALTAVLASGAQVLINTGNMTPMVGASGAIAGILAAYLRMFPHGRIRTVIMIGIFPLMLLVPAWLQIGFWIFLQFLNGFMTIGVNTEATGGVAYFAHIGGFVAGLVLVGLFKNNAALARQRAARGGGPAFQRMPLR